MSKMICFRCKREIKEDEHHYEFVEKDKKEIMKIDYCHKLCWDDFLSKISDTKKAMSMLERLEKPLVRLGIIESNEQVIKCEDL